MVGHSLGMLHRLAHCEPVVIHIRKYRNSYSPLKVAHWNRPSTSKFKKVMTTPLVTLFATRCQPVKNNYELILPLLAVMST